MAKKNKGVTLIALVVTITILLILAGISIAALSGENGLINRAADAKETTEVAQEKEILQQAVVQAMGKNKTGDVVEDELQIACDKVTKTGRIEVDPYKTNKLKAYFTDSKRTYIIDSDGNVAKKKDVKLPANLQVGSIVSYAPTGSTYNWQAEYASSDLTPATDDVTLDSRSGGDFRVTDWVVFKIDEDTGEVQLVPNTMPTGTVRLQGAQGYNNGVKLLNDACSELYKDDSKGITARSINIEDIESLLDEDKLAEAKENSGFGNQLESAFNSGNNYFPLLYEMEKNSVINENKCTKGLEQSDSHINFIGRTDATTLTAGQTTSTNANEGYLIAKTSIHPYETYYSLNLKTNSIYSYNDTSSVYARLFNKSFWVASRYLEINKGRYYGEKGCRFYISSVGWGEVSANGPQDKFLFTSWWISKPNLTAALFPIVTVDCDLISPDGSNFKVNL